jgi:hypothetical protein
MAWTRKRLKRIPNEVHDPKEPALRYYELRFRGPAPDECDRSLYNNRPARAKAEAVGAVLERVVMKTDTQRVRPWQTLNTWLKESPLADQVHCILRYDKTNLVSYCGRVFQLEEATRPVMGARHCEVCEDLKRKRMK